MKSNRLIASLISVTAIASLLVQLACGLPPWLGLSGARVSIIAMDNHGNMIPFKIISIKSGQKQILIPSTDYRPVYTVSVRLPDTLNVRIVSRELEEHPIDKNNVAVLSPNQLIVIDVETPVAEFPPMNTSWRNEIKIPASLCVDAGEPIWAEIKRINSDVISRQLEINKCSANIGQLNSGRYVMVLYNGGRSIGVSTFDYTSSHQAIVITPAFVRLQREYW